MGREFVWTQRPLTEEERARYQAIYPEELYPNLKLITARIGQWANADVATPQES